MEQAGFTPVFANEIWDVAAETYRRNRGLDESQVFVGDINYLVSHLEDFPIPKDVTLVCGGPPCQGFSMANRQRVLDDPRNRRPFQWAHTCTEKFGIIRGVREG